MARKKINFHKGSLSQDATQGKHRGWVMGVFMDRGVRKSKAMEVKYWKFRKGITSHGPKVQKTIEFTLILSGKVQGVIDGHTVYMKSGDYVVIRPGISNNVSARVLSTQATGITVKAPSDPAAKVPLK
jgi:mannose-6-phosphate isomerase-like protein (cupin superfamily)